MTAAREAREPVVITGVGTVSPLGSAFDEVADALLAEADVAVVPGEDFGACARGHIRFSFACSDESIVKGVGRVREWVAKLG